MVTPPEASDPGPPTRPPLTDGGRSTNPSKENRILVVDDEEDFARSVALWLDERWSTTVATDSEEALEKYGPEVDAVLLDRRMPGRSGDEILEEIRARDGDARIAMLTALKPDWDVVDMDFDMYLQKPVDREEVVDAVEELLDRAEYTQELQALFSLSSKLASLQSQYSTATLEEDERFQRLQDEFERVQQQARPHVDELGPDEWAEMMQVVDDGLPEGVEEFSQT